MLWNRVFCVVISHYKDVCSLLSSVFPKDKSCPPVLRRHGIPCRCPFARGVYSLKRWLFYLPALSGVLETLATVTMTTISKVLLMSRRRYAFIIEGLARISADKLITTKFLRYTWRLKYCILSTWKSEKHRNASWVCFEKHFLLAD